jgi:hypothetical protein
MLNKDIIIDEFEENKKMIIEKSNNVEFNNIPQWYKNLLINLSLQININRFYYKSSFDYFLKITGHIKDYKDGYGVMNNNKYCVDNETLNICKEIKENKKATKEYTNIKETKNILYSIDYLLKNDDNMIYEDNKFINHINRFINKYNFNNNIDEIYDIKYYFDKNIIPEAYIDQYRRFLITYEQKNNNDNTDIKKYIKNLIDMNRLIDEINLCNDNEIMILYSNLFNIYNDKYKKNIFKNIISFESYTPQEYQELYNNNYRLGKNIELIKNVGKCLELSKDLCKILNINNPYSNHYNITYKNINDANTYINNNKNHFNIIFKDSIDKNKKEKNNDILYIKHLFKYLYNSDIKLMENYNGRTKNEDKKYKIVNDIFDVVKLKVVKKNIINSNNLDIGVTDLFDDD